VFCTVFLIVFLLVAVTTALMTFTVPESYAGTARIKVAPDPADVAATERSPSASSPSDPDPGQPEVETIQSGPVLDKVIQALDLNTVWGKRYAGGAKLETAETLALLKGRLDLRPVRGTSLIEIRAFSENPDEAANIANAIAEAYHEYRWERCSYSPDNGIKTLRDVFEDQEKSIREIQKQVDQLRNDLTAPQIEADAVRQLQSQLIAFETQLAREQTQLMELEKLSPEQRRVAIQTSLGPEPELNTLLGELNIAEQRLLSLQKDHAPDHPAMQAARIMADDSLKRVTARMAGVMTGLSNRVDAARAIVNNLKTSLETARTEDIKKAKPYDEAKRRLEELEQFRAILATKLASEKVEMQPPRSSPVEIVDKAAPVPRPIRSDKALTIVLRIVGGAVLAAGVGALAALVALLIGRNPEKSPP
jgi:uncharacterized protein involved in exopolysaccharide biosynthesis